MHLASWNDRKRVIEIITDTFEDNPGSVWLLRDGVKRRKAIRCLAAYVFVKAYNRGGAWISENGMGMALCYRFNRRSFSLREFYCLAHFSLFYANIRRRKEIRYREQERIRMRPESGNYLYWWFFGVKKGGGSAGFEISKEIIRYSEKTGLPIYLETAMERNMKVYSRYGYTVYHFWEDREKDIRYWFMRRLPGTQQHNENHNPVNNPGSLK